MADLFNRITSAIKQNTPTTQPVKKPVAETTSPQPEKINVFRPAKTGVTDQVAKTPNTGGSNIVNQLVQAVKDNAPGVLSSRVIAADRRQGKDWSTASDEQKAYNAQYYRTLDDAKHTDMILGLEGMRKDYGAKDWQTAFESQYKAGQEYLSKELADAEKQFGTNSKEYLALKRFSEDYENTARWTASGQAGYSAKASSKQTDDAISTIYAGVVNRPDFYEIAKLGEQEAGSKYKRDLENASDLQKALWYYVYHTDGKDGVKELSRNFLGEALNYQRAASDFASDIDNEEKFTRFWEANKANMGSAMAQVAGGFQQTFTNTEADPNDKTLSGDYTVSDSVDDYLRRQIGGSLSEEDLKKYGADGFAKLAGALGEDWVREASKDASEYQKNLIGFLYLASNGDVTAARDAWNEIKDQSDAIWQMAKGAGTIATKKGTYEGALYRDYLGLSGLKAPEWMGNPGQDEELTVAQAIWDAAQTTRAQYPQIVGNILGGLVNPAVGIVLGSAIMGTQVYGNTYKESIDEGYSKGQAIKYAVAQAMSEFGTDALLSGIAPYAGALTGNAGRTLVRNIANPFLKAVATVGINSLGEGVQEYVQDQLDPVFRNLIFGEDNKIDLRSENSIYSFFLGAISAALMSPLGGVKTLKTNHLYKEFGGMLTNLDATSKMVDTILNSDLKIEKKSLREKYETAKSIAQDIKSGRVKPSDLLLGEMYANAVEAGVDVQWLTNPATMNYNKEALTVEDMAAGAVSMLVDLEGDTSLAMDIARAAKGEQISQEALTAIQNDEKAAGVLAQLMGKLDMSQDNALTRAAQASTRGGISGNKVYDTLKAENTNQTVANPASQQLYAKGVSWETASKVGNIIEKLANGEEITGAEAALIAADNAAIRSVISEALGVDLSEEATAEEILTALNEAAAQRAKIKADQEIVRQSARQAAEARMPIPPASQAQTLSAAGGVEMSHDDFIRRYRDQHGVSQEQAEQAWQQRVYVNNALTGQEETNGTVHGNEERRDDSVASRGAVQKGTERGDRSGRPDDSEGRGVPAAERGSGSEDAPRYRGEKITELNSEQRDFVQDATSDGFTSVTLIKGPLYNVNGVEVNAIAGSDGSLILRWDNPYADPRRVEQHEKIHRWLDEQKNRGAFVMNALWDIVDGNEELLNKLYKIYAQKYGKCYEGLSPNDFVEHIYEEILADMYAGLDLYNAGTAEYEEAAQMYVAQSSLESDFFGEDHQMDFEGMDEFDLSDPFRDSTDFNLPADVRPFPGEEPEHDQLDRFSVSSMAEGTGFEMKLNEVGMPYAIIDPKTGERVTNVTADMIKGTPLGKVVQMAVKSEDNPAGTITEADAKVQYEMLADAMNLIVKYNDAAVVWELVGSQLFSAIKANSDKQYNKTIDFSTICKKTMAIVDAMSESMKRLGRGLTRREVEIVYEEVGKAGEATPCPVCYVFSRWMGIGNLLDQISNFQKKYADMDEEKLVSFMKDIEEKARQHVEAMSDSKKKDFYDKNGLLKIGKAISDMKGKPNNKAAKAIEKLNQHQQSIYLIDELTKAMDKATPAQATRYQEFIDKLNKNRLTQDQIDELVFQMMEADAEIEPYEAYQWLAKTVLMADKAKVNEDGEAIGSWKKNPRFKPVPNDILFDLNRGADFAEHYPLTWAFRTGKGCAMGKAIAPYSDARVGETIQGVAMTDVKSIRVGGMEALQKILDDETLTGRQKATKKGRLNEFLIGNDKKASKTLADGRKKQKQQNLIGGMRYQSTSDFRYEFGSDYLITFFEMQALGANVQLYTKVIEAVDFLASTGADCNLSVMPLGDGYVKVGEDANGNPIYELRFSDATGINAKAAIKKAKQYDNVQLILVGINDTNIRLALESTDVTFVIPFHGSGQSVHQVQTLMDLIGEHLDVTQAQDYTGVQSDQFYPEPTKENRDNPKRVVPLRTKEQKAMWDLRMAIIMGKCEKGLTAEQQGLLAKNEHLQKLYNMFYKDSSDPAYHNYLAKDQAEHIFPYEYWDKEGDYDSADMNGETFRAYCASMGVIPRFSGINSKGERVNFGDFTKDKGYWKLLIDRSMYENKYNEKGDWIGYGKYRAQKTINMSNVKLSDLDPKTGEAQFQNDEMSKQYDAKRKPESRANLDRIVTNAIQRIEAARDNVDIFDRTKVSKGARETIMGAQSALRERMSVAPDEETVVYIKDGYNDETGEAVDFINAILDGVKKGETRNHNSFPYKNWVGLAKGKADGKVYGRVKFGKPYQITKESPEYQDALIAGTDYDIPEGGSKWYYPVLEIEDFRDDPKPFRPIAQTGKYQRASVAPDLTEKQRANYDFNQKQTEVGSQLKTLQGTPIKRYKGGVGKYVQPQLYVHKDYAAQVIPEETLSKAESVLQEKYPDFDYNTLMYDTKTEAVRFDEAPDFDTAREPIAGNMVTVYPDGRTKTGYSDAIWHHKWQWVGDDYDGFDVADSWNWSKQWLSAIRPVDVSEHKFNSSFSQRGIANGTGHGTTNWNEQLDYFGLPHDKNASGAERYSLVSVEPIQPSSDEWRRTHTDAEARKIYPKLWDTTATSGSDNPTQRDQTKSTYRNIYRILQNEGFDGKILDASSGLGVGTLIGQNEFGFDVTDIEPYPSSTRSYIWDADKKDVVRQDGVPYVPMFTDYSTHDDKYDAIISSAVLNVTPQDQRDALVVKMGEMLNPGGKMYVTTRGVSDVNQLAKTGKNIQLGPAEWIETTHNSYQKGFTNPELKAYLEDALGPGFTVEISNKDNGGKFNNNTSIVVTKDGATQAETETPQERYSMMDKQFNDWAPEFYSKMERVINDWTNGKGQPLGAKMAANQVVGWLRGKGVKSEEIKWSGIVPYLEGKKTVTKEELQQIMAENEVKSETKVLESGTGFKFWSDRDWEEVTVDSIEDLYEYAYFLAGEEGFDPEYVKLYPSNDGYYITRDDTGEIIIDATRNDEGDTRWSEYKTDLREGFNYREILFKQPGLNYTNRAMQVHWGGEDMDGAKAEGKDVIAHARVQDTFTPETKGSNVDVPTIFIEEIQSDLHNAGTAKQTPENTRGFTREHAAPGFADKLQREYQQYMDIMDSRDLNPAEQSRYDWIVKQLEPGGLAQAREAYTQAMEQRRALDEDLDQVVAEIKERTRDFQQLGLLRGKDSEIRDWVTASNPRGSFRYADESFLDSLIDGSVNEAYNFPAELIARIENIRAAYQTSRDASEDLIAANRGLSMAPPEVPFAGSSDTYHEYVMKHMLRLAAEGGYDRVAWTTAQQQSDRWSDEYAEGYKIEYDQAIPKFMNKYVKQWGGKVGTTVLDNGDEVWSVDITPEMKNSVLYEGQPRFSVAPDEKNNPFPKGSAENTILEILRKSNNPEELQTYLNEIRQKQTENAKRNTAPVIPSKDKATPVNKVQREIQQNQLQKLINEYGALKKGEKAARDVTLPERTREDRYTRRFARTTEEAAGIPERMGEQIENDLLTTDLLTYGRITDKAAINSADTKFGNLGYKNAIKEWNTNIANVNRFPTKYDIAFGERLMIEAARNGDDAVAMKVLADLAAMGTQAGQVVQASRLLKKLGPTGQLYYVQKAVDRLNKQNEGRIAKGRMDPIVIDQKLAEAVILAETDEQMKEAMNALIKDIADKLPVSLKDKWDAWRYLAMLFNPRTHVRNFVGNAIFAPIRFTKDLLAAAGEQALIKDPMERTKSAAARLGSAKYNDVREFAAADFDEMEPQITGTGKMNPLNEIMNRREIFKSPVFKWLNKVSDFNDAALTKEDMIFLKKAYVNAMTQFIAAKDLSLEELNDGSFESGRILNDARAYAALEAQKATYRDFNRLASALNNAKRAAGVGWLIDGLMPFTKTPMNILRRGVEYSPVGLAKGIYDGLIGVRKGDVTAAQAIDKIAAGMTGSMVAILGYALASMGLARGGGDDDDKKEALESSEGHQKYSLEIGDNSYTIDWAAPVALPFFVGVEIYNQLTDGGQVTIWDWANALTMIADPMMSLSMLDGLNSTLASVRYGDSDEAISSVMTNIVTSYLSQGAPTLFGQVARVIDPDRRSTYVDKNKATPAWLQRFTQGVQGKVPGAASNKMAYVDTWGRRDTSSSLLWRAFENFVSPGYGNKITETPIDRELLRLSEAIGDSSVLPGTVAKYFQVEGERLNLTAEQYEKYKIAVGQKAFSLLGNLMDDVSYISMGDEEKAAAVKKAIEVATALGKQEIAPTYKVDNWIARANSENNIETAIMYQTLKGLNTGLSNYQLISAMNWLTPEDRGKLIMAEHANVSRRMTDPGRKKHEFELTDEQIAREREIYNELFWPEYAALVGSQKFIGADIAGQAELISNLQKALNQESKKRLAEELRAAGIVSTPAADDSDVPAQVTNLYSILNRG